jgi:hypothetical protein
MRRTAEPLTVREIVDRMLADKSINGPRIDQVHGLQSLPSWLPYRTARARD